MPELCQRESRACPPQPRHPRHPPCGDVGTSLGWQPLGEGVHAGQVERVRRLAGLLHRPALRLVSVFELLRGRAHGLAPPAAPRALAAEGPAPRGWDSSPSPPAGGWGHSSGTCPAPWGRCCCQTCSKPSRSASSGDRAQPVTAWPPRVSQGPNQRPTLPGLGTSLPLAMAHQEGSTWHVSPLPGAPSPPAVPAHAAAQQRDGTGRRTRGGRAAVPPQDVSPGRGTSSLTHAVLQGPAVLPLLCPLPAGRLHQADPQLDKRPRRVFLGGQNVGHGGTGGDGAADVGLGHRVLPRACSGCTLWGTPGHSGMGSGAEGPQPLMALTINPAPGNSLLETLQGGSRHR